jgi:hypothetical protein
MIAQHTTAAHAPGVPQNEAGAPHRERAASLEKRAAQLDSADPRRAELLAEARALQRRALYPGPHSVRARDDSTRVRRIADADA